MNKMLNTNKMLKIKHEITVSTTILDEGKFLKFSLRNCA